MCGLDWFGVKQLQGKYAIHRLREARSIEIHSHGSPIYCEDYSSIELWTLLHQPLVPKTKALDVKATCFIPKFAVATHGENCASSVLNGMFQVINLLSLKGLIHGFHPRPLRPLKIVLTFRAKKNKHSHDSWFLMRILTILSVYSQGNGSHPVKSTLGPHARSSATRCFSSRSESRLVAASKNSTNFPVVVSPNHRCHESPGPF